VEGSGIAAVVPEVPTADITILKGHTSEVFTCQFHPSRPELLATGCVGRGQPLRAVPRAAARARADDRLHAAQVTASAHCRMQRRGITSVRSRLAPCSSADATARLWRLNERTGADGEPACTVLRHTASGPRGKDVTRDVASLDWAVRAHGQVPDPLRCWQLRPTFSCLRHELRGNAITRASVCLLATSWQCHRTVTVTP